MPAALQQRLINWGYAVADAAMRRHAASFLEPARDFSYPAVGVGQAQ
jgi:NTE family protein